MNISRVFVLFAIFMIQVWIVQAEMPEAFQETGKPDHKATRELG